jgi:hypothetical protein
MAIRATPRSTGRLGRADSVVETRNYVQRVIENVRVYRVRFEGTAVAAKSDERVVTKESNAAPVPSAGAAPVGQ